uniref:Putative portal protein n=1 Tax=viral metagenome TaxID=1070528 RepID=A0A6M3KZB9_9ZZZZ
MEPNDKNVKVTIEKEKEVIKWLTTQINTALHDRQDLELRWEKWIKQYEEVLPKSKTFPWENCSNISVPITPIAVETIHAREMNAIFSIRPFIQVKPKKKGVDREDCSRLERFLDQIFTNVLDLYKYGAQWLLEKNKMGTGFLKCYWNFDKKKKGEKLVTKDQAALTVIDIEDLIFPVNAKDLESCQWVAQSIITSLEKLACKEKLGIYKNVNDIKSFPKAQTADEDTGSDVKGTKDSVEKLARTSQAALGEYQIHEVWLDYDVDNDGYEERTLLTFHKPSGTKLRWIYAPYDHGRRPFIDDKYQERVNRIYAKGICEISEYLQDGINTVFNQAIDNMTIANVKCFKGRKSARKDIGKIFPGKVFWLDDPTDIEEFLLGEVHQSNFVLHDLLRDYHERRTKVTDYTLGKESSILKSRATATGTLALLQESGRHFDLIINNTRKALVELSYQIIELYAQYDPSKIFLIDGGKEQEAIEISLPNNLENLREEYDFYCTATSLIVNKEIEKQTNLMLTQQLGGIFQQMLQLLMVVFNPQMQLPEEVKSFIFSLLRSYAKMSEDLIRSFEKIDVESYLPELPDVIKKAYGQDKNMIDVIKQLIGGADEQGGGNPALEGANPFGGMEGAGTGVGKPGAGLPQSYPGGGPIT